MKKKQIVSPIARGSGAFVIHDLLAKHIHNYHIKPYSPLRTLMPFFIKSIGSKNTADLVHTTPDYAIFSQRQNVPLVITFHNYVLDRWMRRHSSFLQKIHYTTDLKLWSHLSVKRADALTAVSHYTANLVRKEIGNKKTVKVIYNGVDTNLFKPSSNRKRKTKKVSVFFSGNLTRRKGANWLPEIARRLDPNITIYYTKGLRTRGPFPESDRLRSVGNVPFDEMPRRYREMDILLMQKLIHVICF